MSNTQSGTDVTIVMAGGLLVPGGLPQRTGNAAARSTAGRPDLAPVRSTLTPCPSPEIGRGEQVAPGPFPAGGRGEPVLPPLTTQASNLFQSVAAFVGDGCGIVHDAQYRQRLEICHTCDQRTGKRCAACGCWINVKARGRVFRCPIGKWE